MKKTLLLVFALLSMAVQAQTYNYLTFTDTDGGETSIAASGAVLTFSGSNVSVSNTAGETLSYSLASLASMRFDETTTAIGCLETTPSKAGLVQVYDTAGRLVRSYVGTSSDALAGEMPAGVYVVKSNGLTQKRFVR